MLHASCRRRREGGFSLIELLLVLAIIAILSLVGAPWFMKIGQRNQVKSAGQEFAVTLAAARMRAVKRNLPARVLITPATSSQNYTLIETFEQTQPTPIKVGEVRLPEKIQFPLLPPPTYYSQPTGLALVFGPDGRVQGVASNADSVFTLRGVIGASITNDLPVLVAANGRIEVLGPNPTVAKKRGTAWH
jgi:prepilin-type N-terminal cleavage/methylation domain-containing protein